MESLIWLEESGLGVWIRESMWGYPLIIASHAIGMAIVVGIITMLDLRVLGFASRIPLSSINSLFSIAWIGFFLNILSGILLFCADAERFFFQTVFQIKILLIILGVIALWVMLRQIRDQVVTSGAKITAIISLFCWFGAIAAGRLTAYIGLEK
ncbi:MAG TPA: hypothetical protein VJN91_02130 [Gammaproteobacteria bacterium]|nr:hypothetical protein [Gammaproteobacteria bacterium]